jgi:coproporphyrinogen III oxidase
MSAILDQKHQAQEWFYSLRDKICSEFESLEESAKFERKDWHRPGGGGGEMSVMRGKIFEKVGVNVSTVFGEFSSEMQAQIPGAQDDPNFWACGISLVAHMASPLVPAVHMNTRFIVTTKSWFGGGMDLTPMYPSNEDTDFFHESIKNMCDKHDESYYPKFKEEADKYFYLHHRKEPRGIGGIFYDYLNTGEWLNDFNFTKDVGKSFLEIYLALIKRNMDRKWSAEQREYQLYKRGRYVEFNLLFDRGTKFGVMTNGNPEAYLMSLPPEVKW